MANAQAVAVAVAEAKGQAGQKGQPGNDAQAQLSMAKLLWQRGKCRRGLLLVCIMHTGCHSWLQWQLYPVVSGAKRGIIREGRVSFHNFH